MPKLSDTVKGVTQRQAASLRGWYRKPAPGFYGVKDGFDAAAKGAHVKVSSDKIAEARMRGYLRVLQKYALLEKFDEPIEALAKRFAQSNFGYGEDPKPQAKGRFQGYAGDPMMSPPSPGATQRSV